MKKILLILALCLLLSAAAAHAQPVSLFWPEAEGLFLSLTPYDGLTPISAHVILDIGPDSGNRLAFYAEYRNDGDEPLRPGSNILYCASPAWYGDRYAEEKDLYGWYHTYSAPDVLMPGQTGYCYGSLPLDDYLAKNDKAYVTAEDISWIEIRLFDDEDASHKTDNVPPVTATVEPLPPPQGSRSVFKTLRVTVANDSGEDIAQPNVAVCAYDAQGRLLYMPYAANVACYESDDMFLLPDGGSLVVDLYVDDAIGAILEAGGLEDVEYRCLVY